MAKKILKFYSYKDCPAECDVPDQAWEIVEVIKEVTKQEPIERNDLLAILERRLTTKQSVSRILSYYQRVLMDNNCIEVERREIADD